MSAPPPPPLVVSYRWTRVALTCPLSLHAVECLRMAMPGTHEGIASFTRCQSVACQSSAIPASKILFLKNRSEVPLHAPRVKEPAERLLAASVCRDCAGLGCCTQAFLACVARLPWQRLLLGRSAGLGCVGFCSSWAPPRRGSGSERRLGSSCTGSRCVGSSGPGLEPGVSYTGRQTVSR